MEAHPKAVDALVPGIVIAIPTAQVATAGRKQGDLVRGEGPLHREQGRRGRAAAD